MCLLDASVIMITPLRESKPNSSTLASQPTRPANQPTSQILTFCQPARPANQPTSQPANQPSRPPAYLGRLVHRGGELFLTKQKCKTPAFFDHFRGGLFKKNMFFAFWRLFYNKNRPPFARKTLDAMAKGMFVRLFLNEKWPPFAKKIARDGPMCAFSIVLKRKIGRRSQTKKMHAMAQCALFRLF